MMRITCIAATTLRTPQSVEHSSHKFLTSRAVTTPFYLTSATVLIRLITFKAINCFFLTLIKDTFRVVKNFRYSVLVRGYTVDSREQGVADTTQGESDQGESDMLCAMVERL